MPNFIINSKNLPNKIQFKSNYLIPTIAFFDIWRINWEDGGYPDLLAGYKNLEWIGSIYLED